MKKFTAITACLILTSLVWAGGRTKKEVEKTMEKETSLTGKKIVLIIASSNFRDEEYFEPKKILTDAGAHITTASSSLDEATGMLGQKAKPDVLLNNVKADDYDAVIFIGGSGSEEYWENKVAHALAQDTVKKGKILGAIYIAPVTLAKAGVLKGKKATAFSSAVDKIKSEGAVFSGNNVEIDGKIITADGPSSAKSFGEGIKKLLQ